MKKEAKQCEAGNWKVKQDTGYLGWYSDNLRAERLGKCDLISFWGQTFFIYPNNLYQPCSPLGIL